jgi:hypothetical protein
MLKQLYACGNYETAFIGVLINFADEWLAFLFSTSEVLGSKSWSGDRLS